MTIKMVLDSGYQEKKEIEGTKIICFSICLVNLVYFWKEGGYFHTNFLYFRTKIVEISKLSAEISFTF